MKTLSGPKDHHLQKDGDPDRKIDGPDFRYGKAEYFLKEYFIFLN